MKVTDVEVTISDVAGEHTLAVANVVLDGELKLRGVRVMSDGDGPFVAMPGDGGCRTWYTPMSSQLHDGIRDAVLEAYRSRLEAGGTR